MELLNSYSSKDLIVLIFAIGGAWSFVRFTIKAIKGDIIAIKKDNEREKRKLEVLENKMFGIDKSLAVMLEKVMNTNDTTKRLEDLIKNIKS